jgi:hypothetical protein
MKRLRRSLSAVLTVLSLLLSIAAASLWVRSYWRDTTLESTKLQARGNLWRFSTWELKWVRGDLNWDETVWLLNSPSMFNEPDWGDLSGKLILRDRPVADVIILKQTPLQHLWFRFNWKSYHNSPEDPDPTTVWGSSRLIQIPLWLLVLVFGAAPTIRGWRVIRKTRSHGICQRCGYDLRATPERCPECGRVTAPEKRAENSKIGGGHE